MIQNITAGPLQSLHLAVSAVDFAVTQSLNILHIFFGRMYFGESILK